MSFEPIPDVASLEERLSRPSEQLIAELAGHEGDLAVLGAGGKMGPTLARMARRALDASGNRSRVIAVSRFADKAVRAGLESCGAVTVAADLLEPGEVEQLPDATSVLYLAGAKFGTAEAPERTWAANTWMPALAARRYRKSRIVAFSTGNVYPLVPVNSGGADESTAPDPVGEYAWSALARERTFAFCAERFATPLLLYRLNYAVELRYGVLVDLARQIAADRPIDLSMGHLNAIWQGDASDRALRCLTRAGRPPVVLNVTGGETLSVRSLAERLGRLLGRTPRFEGEQQRTALLSDAGRAGEWFGPPPTALDDILPAVAEWILRGGPTLDKPTHYDVRDGRF